MKSLWSEKEARPLKGVDLLVYRSRLIGQEADLVLHGGGNTSMKLMEKDHLGRTVRVLRVKGSGSDLATSMAKDYAALRLEELLAARGIASMTDEEMVDFLQRCLMDPKAPRPSIETLMHAFIPYDHVDHSHADAIVSVTNTEGNQSLFNKIFGDEMVWVPYIKPGFPLAKSVEQRVKAHPSACGAILEKHGIFTWGKMAKESYETMIEMVSRAEDHIRSALAKKRPLGRRHPAIWSERERQEIYRRIAPIIRGRISRYGRCILDYTDGKEILDFVNSEKAADVSQRGPATPDHLLRTKRSPLFISLNPRDSTHIEGVLARSLDLYAKNYERYFKRHAGKGDRLMDPLPRVILVSQLGLIGVGKDKRAARIARDIGRHTCQVMRNGMAVGNYRSLKESQIFEMEYWPLELFKLTLAPREQDLARRVALITGASGGIGRGTAIRFAREGCHVVVGDVDKTGLQRVANEISSMVGNERCLALSMNVSREDSVRRAFEETVLAYGGLDIVVSNAGIALSHPIDVTPLSEWERSLSVNATGHFLVGREAVRLFKRQGFGGNIVFVATKNVMAPGRDFGAYSAAKAAEAQLARVLAIENGEHGIRVNCVNPDAVFQDSKIWSAEVRKERAAAHGIPPSQLEDFYRCRNLLHAQVTPADVAESILFLASDRSSKTTGCTLTVDGGVKEAFPR